MAYTKIHAIKTTLSKALDYIENPEKTTLTRAMGYIENPEKTEDQLLVSGYNVDPLTASIEFTVTAATARHVMGSRGAKRATDNLAYHLIQSFSPQDNVTPEQAHELGKRLANELLEGKYEYVIATHVDKGHLHNHIIFNATSFYDFKKFRSQPGKTARQIRAISDRICAEADLSVIKTPQLGRSYQYRAPKYGQSWKREIRRRLQFVLEAAGSFEEFVDGAARLGVTVENTGKDLSYRMEGQQRPRRGRSLDKDGAFTRQGIEDQLAANTDLRERLKENIREAVAVSTNCKGFRAELQRRGIAVKETRSFGLRYTIDGDAQFREWALGPAYSTEALQAALLHREDPFQEMGSALDGIEERFLRTNQSRSIEVPIAISRDQILKTTADGILAAVPGEEGKAGQLVFIDRSHVSYQRETDDFKIYVGNGYDYYVATADGERTGGRVRGESIIRALQLKNGVQPEYIDIMPEDVKAISPKGLTLSIPELGIESLFIENRFMEYDRLNGGSARAAIYADWSYSFHAADQSSKYLSGRELIQHLKQRQGEREGSLLGRINAMRRRSQLAETKQLAQSLLLIRQEGITDMEGFASRLADLERKQASLQASIATLQTKNEAYKKAAGFLVTYHTYLPVKLASMELSGKARRSYELTHKGELDAWSYAEGQLEKLGVMAEVDPDKVLALVKEQDREISALKAQAGELSSRAAALERAQEDVIRAKENTQQPTQRRAQDRDKLL